MRDLQGQGDRGSFIAWRLAVGYALLATLSAGVALIFRGELPWTHPEPWLDLDRWEAFALSGTLGLGLAMLVVLGTRLSVTRFDWARRLHGELRPVARVLSPLQIVLIALLSSLGEELLFRGVLVPWVGVILSSVLFGLAHQMRGPSRWVWVGWASVVGLALGALFAATGSLLGPVLAHAVVNGINLAYLRAHDPNQGDDFEMGVRAGSGVRDQG